MTIDEQAQGYARAMKLALYYLEMRSTTCHRLYTYLQRKQLPERTAAQVIAELVRMGYLDDAVYAQRYVELRLARSGSRKLRAELRARGVEEEVIDATLAAISDEDMLHGAQTAAREYLRGKQGDLRTLRSAAYRALARRGYAPDLIERALHAAMQGMKDEPAHETHGAAADDFAQALEAARRYRRTYSEPDPHKQRQKTYAALARRGYKSDCIQAVLAVL